MFIPSTAPVDLTGINHNFYGNIQYGSINREVIDVFIPTDPVIPTGICIYFHGGGFFQGDKSALYNASGEAFIQELLNNGIAVAAANYEFINTEVEWCGQINSLKSAKVAIQFLKFYSQFFNLDVNKFVIRGSSAGAGIGMYLGYQQSLGDPTSENVIFQQDTTVGAVALTIPQATYDLVRWETDIFDVLGYTILADIQNNPDSYIGLLRTYGIQDYGDLFTEQVEAERREQDFLRFITEGNAVPTYIKCAVSEQTELNNFTLDDINHHPYHPRAIKDYLDSYSVENVAYIDDLGIIDPSGETQVEFIIRKVAEL